MLKNSLGNVVASSMNDILHSSEYNSLFGKKADEATSTAKDCSCDCKKCKDLGKHAGSACNCGMKPVTASENCSCDCKACKEMDKHAGDACKCAAKPAKNAKLTNIFNTLVEFSKELDELNFNKSAASLINSAKKMIVEAQVIQLSEDEAEKLLNDAPVDVVVNDGGLDPRLTELARDLEDEPTWEDIDEPTLENLDIVVDEDEEPAPYFAGKDNHKQSVDELLKELDMLGKDRVGEEKVNSMIDEELAKANAFLKEVDSWLVKNADEEILNKFSMEKEEEDKKSEDESDADDEEFEDEE